MSWTCVLCKKHLLKTSDIYQCWDHRLPDMMIKYNLKPGQIICLKGCSERLEVEQDILVVKRNAELPKVALFTDIFTDHDRRIEEERDKVFDEMLRELSGDGVVGLRQEGSTLIVERGFEWDATAVRSWRRFSLKLGFLWDRITAVKEVIWSTKTMIAGILILWSAFWLVVFPGLIALMYMNWGNMTTAEIIKEYWK